MYLACVDIIGRIIVCIHKSRSGRIGYAVKPVMQRGIIVKIALGIRISLRLDIKYASARADRSAVDYRKRIRFIVTADYDAEPLIGLLICIGEFKIVKFACAVCKHLYIGGFLYTRGGIIPRKETAVIYPPVFLKLHLFKLCRFFGILQIVGVKHLLHLIKRLEIAAFYRQIGLQLRVLTELLYHYRAYRAGGAVCGGIGDKGYVAAVIIIHSHRDTGRSVVVNGNSHIFPDHSYLQGVYRLIVDSGVD